MSKETQLERLEADKRCVLFYEPHAFISKVSKSKKCIHIALYVSIKFLGANIFKRRISGKNLDGREDVCWKEAADFLLSQDYMLRMC